jgi:hypothetical protein
MASKEEMSIKILNKKLDIAICPTTILSKIPVENNPAHREEEKPE